MRVLIVGHLGNMGRRYAKILDYLGVKWVGYDLQDPFDNDEKFTAKACSSTHAIIATQTCTHIHTLDLLAEYKLRMLCEKPICTDVQELDRILKWAEEDRMDLEMVNQYKFIPKADKEDDLTLYDYFKSGTDGLAWDCISIISLAEGPVLIAGDSPIWHCKINGRNLNIADMDQAYIDMVQWWLDGKPLGGIDWIRTAHKKVKDYIDQHARWQQ